MLKLTHFGIVFVQHFLQASPTAVNQLKTEILLCDDEANLVVILADYLRNKGYGVSTAKGAQEAFEIIRSKTLDIALVDAKMPDVDGFEFLDTLRKSGEMMPIILMGDHLAQSDIIKAYNLGCDAYIDKPFAVELLICKIEAILRRCRTNKPTQEKIFELDGKIFDGEKQTFDGQHLSARENDLLLLLWRNKGELVERHLILRSLWRDDSYFASRSLSVYINRLRHILHETNLQILAVNKRGYRIVNTKEQSKVQS